MDFREIEKKWRKKWEESKIFEAIPDSREKFFVNVAYPYANGYGHLGHLFTFQRGDVLARFKRMQGYNVLYPQSFHTTGQPIVAAARRVKEKEEKQIKILKDMGINEGEIEKFSEPSYWLDFFPEGWKKNFQDLGFSVDWRRSFITTDLNRPYDAFIKWQFNKLKEKNLVAKGEHAVVFCEKCGFPIGDHDRSEGEGVVPEEVILLKFKMEDKLIPVMTYRPETIYGVTNLWVNPKGDYVEIEVSKNGSSEKWYVSREIIPALKNQDFEVKELSEVSGKDLVKKKVLNPVTENEILVLPAEFVDTKIGSGVVMSVPAHAPFDYVAIKELRENKELRERYGIKEEELKFDFISLIKMEGYGDFPAAEIVESKKVKSPNELNKLNEATEEIYKKEFHTGVLKIPSLEGRKVSEVKEELITKFLNEGIGNKFYIIPEEVICRCLTPAIVKIVKDQWFLNYSDKEWKDKTHELANRMNFFPNELRDNFNYTIDWLRDWACTRDKRTSIGTTLPFDETQMIESLSDSTIYMAYYTISDYLQKGNLKGTLELKDSFFDYVFLGEGAKENVAKENNVELNNLDELRRNFLYWYQNGFQTRISGKDLIQNHLTFCLFNHIAIFPEENLPEGISVNGHVMIDGEKMSKSKGNVVLIKEAIKEYPGDVLRFAVAYAGNSGLDDVNIELKEIKTVETKLRNYYEFAIENYGTGKEEYQSIEKWFDSIINRILKKLTGNYSQLNTKSVLQEGFFELQNQFKWYKRRTLEPNKDLLSRFIEVQTKILAPICPFMCEEIWEKIGKKEFISLSTWPEIEEDKVDERIEIDEEIILNLLEDIRAVIKLAKVEPKKIKVIVPEKWKYSLYKQLGIRLAETRDFGELIKEAMSFDEAKKDSKGIQKLVKRSLSNGINFYSLDEEKLLDENKGFFEKEFSCEFEITKEQIKESWPGKFGIIVD